MLNLPHVVGLPGFHAPYALPIAMHSTFEYVPPVSPVDTVTEHIVSEYPSIVAPLPYAVYTLDMAFALIFFPLIVRF